MSIGHSLAQDGRDNGAFDRPEQYESDSTVGIRQNPPSVGFLAMANSAETWFAVQKVKI
jgi:hypothetical protein